MERADLTGLVAFSETGAHHETVFRTQHLWSEIVCLDRNQSTDAMTEPDADVMLTIVAGEVVVYLDRRFKRFK